MKKLVSIKRSNGAHWVGDGFPVRNIFSYNDIAKDISPFLLLDYGGPTRFEPTRAKRGVGGHPHRGFETVTIVYAGEVEHRDSTGGGGIIASGDVQWMTAASGLVHEEFHGPNFAKTGGLFEMVQLWVNLPARDKMTSPRYQGIPEAKIPSIPLPGQSGSVRVIAGEYSGCLGPAQTFSPLNVWDIRVLAGRSAEFRVPEGYTTSLFVLKGGIRLPEAAVVGEAELAILETVGTNFEFEALEDSTLLLLNGKPLDEPIVGQGPFVMNTPSEVRQAFIDFQSGRMGHLE